MPTAFREGPYRFFFYSADGHEPPHTHVERDDNVGKFWLDPVRLAESGGFGAKELRTIQQSVIGHRDQLLRIWNDYFTD